MGKLTPELRGRLTGLVDGGMSISNAARDIGCSRNVASKWIRRNCCFYHLITMSFNNLCNKLCLFPLRYLKRQEKRKTNH